MKRRILFIFCLNFIYYLTMLLSDQKINAESVRYYEIKATKAYENGDFNKSIFYFSRAIQIDPKAANAYAGRCGMKINIGEYQQALDDCQRALLISLNDKDIDLNKSILFANMCGAKLNVGDIYESISDCDEAIKLDPRGKLAFYNRSIAKEKIGDIKGACIDARSAKKFGYKNRSNDYWIKENC